MLCKSRAVQFSAPIVRFSSSAGSAGLINQPVGTVLALMASQGIHRLAMTYSASKGKLVSSNPVFQEVADAISADSRDFHEHEAIFLERGKRSGALVGAVIHKTIRGQAAGGVRYWKYDTLQDYLRDGLRLSRGMGRKNALAGLWWGGGKGLILKDEVPRPRDKVFEDYGAFVSGLNGCYVTAEDAGVTPPDIGTIFSKTRFVTSIPPDFGGSGNPSIMTGLGVVCAMEAALDHMAMGTLSGKKVAVQGAGNVARYMTKYLVERNIGKVILSDIHDQALEIAKEMFQKEIDMGIVELRKVSSPNDQTILFEKNMDIVSPCALGGTLNSQTIPNIQAPIICGAANNQLLNDQTDDKLLQNYGRVYVPDYLSNRMGIVNCSNEQYGHVDEDPAIQRHFGRKWDNSIFVKVKQILRLSESQNISTSQAADQIADELSLEPHPIWGHRSMHIVHSLIKNNWHESESL